MQELQLLTKKIKKHKRDALVPLYNEHALYLARVVKTLTQNDVNFSLNDFVAKIPAWQQVATCHEIAINSCSRVCNLETHENHRGKEREYTTHEKAKNVGRDLRVQIIWSLVFELLTNTSKFDDLEVYEDDFRLKTIICPICEDILYIQEERVVGYHSDGTENTILAWKQKQEVFDCGDHLIYGEAFYSLRDDEDDKLINLTLDELDYTWEEVVDFAFKNKAEGDWIDNLSPFNEQFKNCAFLDWGDFWDYARILYFNILLDQY